MDRAFDRGRCLLVGGSRWGPTCDRLGLDAVTRVARYGLLGMLGNVCHVTHP
ncbi:hypothetical protein RB11679 [Rhodopirellula baltica SH 1]|uniref:Uncharacterized protein n=1 Tax=Rhodopirellula baltica (strain DSM 10527 / NCIMB 13988 / SH1) TaxID=243090 RepID=Q7UDZ5_RHOBA|nr:hypothetical protein RB11679 [Rhodopirellula baltica SH 1]